MKLLKQIFTAVLIFGTAAAALAVPPSKRTSVSPALRTTEQFSQLKSGDKVAYVCKECDSVTVATIESKDDGMKLCKEGDKVDCPSCKKVFRVVRKGPPSKGTTQSEVRYVNEKGEECMFVVKLSE